MRQLSIRLMDIFVNKNEKKFNKGDFSGGKRAADAFEAALPLILENVSISSNFCQTVLLDCFRFTQVLIDYIKLAFIDMEAENLMIPWIYLCFNKDFA
jgi:hypothetical protein